jgi:hypothetical protein
MTATNKRYSYLRITVIRIDVHPAGETRSTCYTLFTLDSRRVSDHTSHVVHAGNILLVLTRLKQTPTPGRSLGDQRQTGPAVALGHHILPSSRQSWSRGERFQPSGYTATSTYWVHIPACDRYVQCLLMGSTHRFLIDTGRGYNLRGAGFLHTTIRPSQLTVSNFHLRAPPDFRLNNSILPKDLEREQTLNLTSWSLHSTSTVSYHLNIVCASHALA